VTQTAVQDLWCAYAVIGPVGDDVELTVGSLELVGDADVAVVTARVPASEFGEEALAEHLNDREWVERAALEHQAVVQRLLRVTTVVPLRFGSLHRNRDAVEEFLHVNRDGYLAALQRLRGRVELGVKVWLAPPPSTSSTPGAATGREYLERQRAARQEATARRRSIDGRLRSIHERLLTTAEGAVLNRPQPRELTGDPREMAINAAYLVAAGDDALAVQIELLRTEHPDLVFEVTGPWAPYNFVEETDR
jgi:Gas vesicle synthesis protein GvpL/GvpF